jgi:hypothetical protein
MVADRPTSALCHWQLSTERTYEQSESGPSAESAAGAINYCFEYIATSDRKTAAALERNILQPLLVCTDPTI